MYTILETFVGTGGSHLGFIRNGFKSIYVNDFDKNCLKTLVYNNSELSLDNNIIIDDRSIEEINPTEILKQTKMKQGELDVLFGGLVCKGFSMAGERSPNDKRNYYYKKQLEFVKVFQPKISIIENVPNIQKAKILSSNTPSDVAEKVDVIWQNICNYNGKSVR